MMILALVLLLQAAPAGERPVDPYTQSDANAGASPFTGDVMWRAFHRQAGVDRIVDEFVARNRADKRIADIFMNQDFIRLRRTLKEQFCYILGGGCIYTGRDMATAHRNMGVQTPDFNAVVENLRAAMRQEGVPFFAQNRFLAKLAPMRRDIDMARTHRKRPAE